MAPQRSWTDEERTQVRQWLLDGWSLGQVGKRLGLSRNAAIGRCHRDKDLHHLVGRSGNHLPREPKPPKPPPQQPARRVRVVVAGTIPLEPRFPGGGVSLLELRVDQCRFPIGFIDGRHLFCAAPTPPERSWCRGHAQVVFDYQRHPSAGKKLRK